MLLRFSLNDNLLTILDEDTLARIVNTLTAHVIPDSLAILAELHDVDTAGIRDGDIVNIQAEQVRAVIVTDSHIAFLTSAFLCRFFLKKNLFYADICLNQEL